MPVRLLADRCRPAGRSRGATGNAARPAGQSRVAATLGGRLLIATLAAATFSLLAGLLTWAGAASQGVSISLPRMLEAGANGVPISSLFLGIAAFAYTVAPRASDAIAYGVVGAAFIWYLVGSFFGLPKWVTDLTPFQHIGLVPIQSFQAEAAGIMITVGLTATAAAIAVFRHRDLLAA